MFLVASEYTIKNLFLRNTKKKNPVTSINSLRLYHIIYNIFYIIYVNVCMYVWYIYIYIYTINLIINYNKNK